MFGRLHAFVIVRSSRRPFFVGAPGQIHTIGEIRNFAVDRPEIDRVNRKR